jgi:hypothetical protein
MRMRATSIAWHHMTTGTWPPGILPGPAELRAVRLLNTAVNGGTLLALAGIVLTAAWALTGSTGLLTAGYCVIGTSFADFIALTVAGTTARLRSRRRAGGTA